MGPYVHPSAHSCSTHNAPPLRIKNWLIGTKPFYAFSFFIGGASRKEGLSSVWIERGEIYAGAIVQTKKVSFFLLYASTKSLGKFEESLGTKAELHKERLWFKVLRGMRRKCFEESLSSFSCKVSLYDHTYPSRILYTLLHISKAPNGKKVSAFVSFHPIPKPRREGRKRREECLSFNGARKICIPGHGQFQWKIFVLPCLASCHCIPFSTVHVGVTMYESNFSFPLSPSISFARLERKIFSLQPFLFPQKGKKKSLPHLSLFFAD